jgi:thiosulfate/3-mercaptopyruvate sulfurtransferase
MREPNALVSTEALSRDLGDCNLRIFDCTTHLEPPPPDSDDPYVAVPGRSIFEAAHIPGADFLDLQGGFPTTRRGCAS